VPSYDLQDFPFEERYAQLIGNISYDHPFIVSPPLTHPTHATSYHSSPFLMVSSLLSAYPSLLSSIHPTVLFISQIIKIPVVRMLCITKKQLKKALHDVISDGGEGLIMRKPKSIYEPGRTSSLVKLKVFSIQILSSTFPGILFSSFKTFFKASRGDREGIVVSVDTRNAITLKLYDFYLLLFSFHYSPVFNKTQRCHVCRSRSKCESRTSPQNWRYSHFFVREFFDQGRAGKS
jgi:ATP dependent DNA ligase domain